MFGMENYPVPDDRMKDDLWTILCNAVKMGIAVDVKGRQLDDIGIASEVFFDDISSVQNPIIFKCFGIKPVEVQLTEDELKHEIEESKHYCRDMRTTKVFLDIHGTVRDCDDVYNSIIMCIDEGARNVINDEIDIDDAAYRSARDLYYDLFDTIKE